MLEKALLRKSFFIPLGICSPSNSGESPGSGKTATAKETTKSNKINIVFRISEPNPKLSDKELSRERNLLVSFYVYYSGIYTATYRHPERRQAPEAAAR